MEKEKQIKILLIASIIIFLTGSVFLVLGVINPSCPECEEIDKISANEAKRLTEDFIRQVMFGLENAEVISIEEEDLFYKLRIDLDGKGIEIVESLVTKDGVYLIPAMYELGGDLPDFGFEDIPPVESIDVDLSTIPLDENKLDIIYFWGDGCPFCDQMIDFLDSIMEDHSEDINLIKYEVWYDLENEALMMGLNQEYGLNINSVPLVFIGDEHFLGFNQEISENILNHINSCLETKNCEISI